MKTGSKMRGSFCQIFCRCKRFCSVLGDLGGLFVFLLAPSQAYEGR